MGKTSTLKASIALLLIMLLFLCVAAFSHTTTKTFAAHMDATITPTAIVTVTAEPSPTVEPSPSPTSQPSPSPTPRPRPTPKPSPTMVPSPTPTATLAPTATPQPTATSVPTAVPSPTVGITPTVGVKPTVGMTPTVAVTPTMVYPTPIATQKAGAGPLPMPTAVPTQPTTTPVDITSKKTTSATQSPLHSDSPMVPLFVGTLLTLCLGAGGFVGVRRARTALLPAIDMKKQRNHTFAHSWQRVRTAPTQVPPLRVQETLPFAPVPLQEESAVSLSGVEIAPLAIMDEDAVADEGPKTGSHRRLGPVRLRKITKTERVVPVLPVEAQPLPKDIEDMSFLDDPLLQDTLRHYRQKGQKKD